MEPLNQDIAAIFETAEIKNWHKSLDITPFFQQNKLLTKLIFGFPTEFKEISRFPIEMGMAEGCNLPIKYKKKKYQFQSSLSNLELENLKHFVKQIDFENISSIQDQDRTLLKSSIDTFIRVVDVFQKRVNDKFRLVFMAN